MCQKRSMRFNEQSVRYRPYRLMQQIASNCYFSLGQQPSGKPPSPVAFLGAERELGPSAGSTWINGVFKYLCCQTYCKRDGQRANRLADFATLLLHICHCLSLSLFVSAFHFRTLRVSPGLWIHQLTVQRNSRPCTQRSQKHFGPLLTLLPLPSLPSLPSLPNRHQNFERL